MKLTPQALQQLIKEELEVILTDDEAAELFGDQFKERLMEIIHEATRMYSHATDEKVPDYRGFNAIADEETQVRSRNASGSDRRSQDPRRSERRPGTRTRRDAARGPRRKAARERRAKDTADKMGRKWAPGREPDTQVTLRRQGPRPASKSPAMPPGSPDPSGLLKQVAAAQRQARLAAIKTAIKKYGVGALSGADLLFAIEGGYLGGKASQAPLSRPSPLRKKMGLGGGIPLVQGAPEYIQSGEGFVDDPRSPDWDPDEMVKNAGGWGITDIDPSAPITKYVASQLRGQPEATPFKRKAGKAADDPEYLAQRQAERDAGMRAGGYDPDNPASVEKANRDLASYLARESLNHRGNKMTEKHRTEKVREAAQLELPGLETPEACEPADSVEDLSAQLAQMVVDSEVPPEHFNDLMELIYDKVAAGLENIGVEDEEDSDDYRRTSIGFMEDLRNATLKILMEQQPPPDDDTSGTQQTQVAGKEAASEEAQSAAQSANPGTPQASGTQAGHAAAQAAMRKVSQQGGDVFTGGEESATVGTARKEDDKLNENVAFNRFVKLAGI